MISYGLIVILIVRELRAAHPQVTQLWYADDVVAGGYLPHIQAHMHDILTRLSPRGYFLDPTKSILVVSVNNVAWAQNFFWGNSLNIGMESQYLGGYIGYTRSQADYLEEKVQYWVDRFSNMTGV